MLAELPVEIETERYKLKTLTIDDVSSKYLSWFLEPTVQKFIVAAKQQQTMSSLRNFVEAKWRADDCLFLGIFSKDGDHIGNLKFEPVSFAEKCAVMGILIGDAEYRGKGVSSEVILAGSRYLKTQALIEDIELGVQSENLAAIKSYKKVGFKVIPSGKLIKPVDKHSLIMSFKI